MHKVFTGMHKVYSSEGGMAVYFLVFNIEWLLDENKCKATVDFITFWANSIAKHSRGAPVVLIGTHKDKVVSAVDLLKSNAELAKSNPAIRRAHDMMRDLITDLRVYKLNQLQLRMPTQPSSFDNLFRFLV